MASWLSNTANGYRIRVTVTTQSQSTANRESTLSWKIEIINPSNHWFHARSTGNVKIGGKTVWSISGVSINSGGAAGTTTTMASGTTKVKHDSLGDASVSVSAAFRTDSQASGWRVPQLTISGKTFKPPRIQQRPGKPTAAPTVTQNQSTRLITVVSATASATGGTINKYQVRRRHNASGSYGSWATSDMNNARRFTFTPEHANTNYQFQTRAIKNVGGTGEWSNTTTFKSMSTGPFVRHSGTWRNTIAYVKIDGEWKVCMVYVKSGGQWRVVGG